MNHYIGRRTGREHTSGDGIVWALRHVTFRIQTGRVVGLVGGNGSGKSVLLRILARVTKPTEGRSDVYGALTSILSLGAVLNPELTGRDNIHQTGTLLQLRRSTIEQSFDEIVRFSGIEPHLDSLVRGYSAGMQLRLAFAVVAHLESGVLLIDEALSVADESFRALCAERIRQMASERRTVIIVSHELELLADLCDEIIVLAGGRLVAHGPARSVLQGYREQTASSPVAV